MVRRGQVWWAELSEPNASETGYRRPVIIIQANAFNVSRIRTVVVVAITSNLRLAKAPGNVLLTKANTGLYKSSVANVSQIITIDKDCLTEQAGDLDHLTMGQISEGLQLVLGI
jgi:mRNA interferase MazF